METAIHQKWDYQILTAASMESLTPLIIQAGNAGWELVTVCGGAVPSDGAVKTLRARRSADLQAIFKRPQL